MFNKDDINIAKKDANDYIEFMESAGCNAKFAKVLLSYIEQLEKDNIAFKKRTELIIEKQKKMEG